MTGMSKPEILLKPDGVSWDEIHDVLYRAHAENREKGVDQHTAHLSGEQIREMVGDGYCFVALLDGKVVGTCSYIIVTRNRWYAQGPVAYIMLLGVLPEYKQGGISKQLDAEITGHILNSGIRIAELYTSEGNRLMQDIWRRRGYRFVSYTASPKTTYYSVLMAKWLDGWPYSKLYCQLRFLKSKYSCKLRYKPGGVRRFARTK